MRGFFLRDKIMPLPNILDFIGNNVTQAGFKTALEKLLNYLNVEGATKAELTPKADKTYVDTALVSFQNGAVKTYPTLAAANADIANIQLNSKVSVLSVTDGGDYYKASSSATNLTKSPYDALSLAKADASNKADTAKSEALMAANSNTNSKINELKNSSIISYDASAFTNTGYISDPATGTITNSGITRYTGLIEVRKGDVITVSNLKVRNQFSVALYDTNQVFKSCGGLVGSDSQLSQTFKISIQQDGFIRIFNVNTNTAVSVIINRLNAVLYGVADLSNKKSLSLKRFYNDELFSELLKVGSNVFTQNQIANYLTSGTTAQTGYAYYGNLLKAGDLVKISARMDAGSVLAFFEDASIVKSQVIKTGEGIGTLSEILFEAPSDGRLTINSYVDALNDHCLTFYKKEKPYGIGEDRALSHNDYMSNGKYNIDYFKQGFFVNTSGTFGANALAFTSKTFKVKAGQVVNLYQKSFNGLTSIVPITVYDLSMNKIANVTTSTLQSSGFYLSTYLATADCYVIFSVSNAYISTNSTDCYAEIPMRQVWDFRKRNLYVYGDSQAVLAGIASPDYSLGWPSLIASRLGVTLSNTSMAGRGMVQSTTSAVTMIQLYNTTDYIKDYQKGDYLMIELWANDSSTSGGNTPVTPTAFKATYRTVLDYILKDKKWPASNVKLVGGFWQPSKTQARLDLEVAVKELAAEYNVQSTNCNDYMARQSDPASLIQSDGLHMTYAGNAVAADWMYSVFNFGRS